MLNTVTSNTVFDIFIFKLVIQYSTSLFQTSNTVYLFFISPHTTKEKSKTNTVHITSVQDETKWLHKTIYTNLLDLMLYFQLVIQCSTCWTFKLVIQCATCWTFKLVLQCSTCRTSNTLFNMLNFQTSNTVVDMLYFQANNTVFDIFIFKLVIQCSTCWPFKLVIQCSTSLFSN